MFCGGTYVDVFFVDVTYLWGFHAFVVPMERDILQWLPALKTFNENFICYAIWKGRTMHTHIQYVQYRPNMCFVHTLSSPRQCPCRNATNNIAPSLKHTSRFCIYRRWPVDLTRFYAIVSSAFDHPTVLCPTLSPNHRSLPHWLYGSICQKAVQVGAFSNRTSMHLICAICNWPSHINKQAVLFSGLRGLVIHNFTTRMPLWLP